MKVLHILLLCIAWLAACTSATIDRQTCNALLADFERRSAKPAVPANPSKMLFFLHIPRTAGRTYHSCFLKLAYPPSKRCAKSYDVLRLNVSTGSCGLLSSHDDWSATEFLPPEAAIITQLRDPVGRMLSAYEFAVEVAARVLTRPKNYTADPTKVNTRNVWPWAVLVPFVEEDMLRRVAAERSRGSSVSSVHEPLDPYNNSLIMPLAAFVSHPLVEDTLGNGQAMQVLGLTSYSHWPEAAQLRQCARTHASVQKRLLQVAEKRVRSMLHVGLMEELLLSIASLAANLRIKLGGPTWKAVTANAFSYENQSAGGQDGQEVQRARDRLQILTLQLHDKKGEVTKAQEQWRAERRTLQVQQQEVAGGKALQEPDWLTKLQRELAQLQEEVTAASQEAHIVRGYEAQGPARQILPDDHFRTSLTVRDAYLDCSQRARVRNASRKANSLRGLVTTGGQAVEFTEAARQQLRPELLRLIRERNTMDTAIYELGKGLLHDRVAQQHAAGSLERMPVGQHSRQQRARLRDKIPVAAQGAAKPKWAAPAEVDELR